ncbi:MAG TPA: carboxypeptidase-like regulatory domain-containing protein, partial [Paludibacteraceae bacterium]|nr:carboxypeptidase-like regulatory domain-containing protein [Paludibacteraceae bacterium]
MKTFYIFLIGLLVSASMHSQIIGKVLGENKEPLIGANIYWENTNYGVLSSIDGNFEIEKMNTSDRLIISYLGYKSDTIQIT